MKLFVKKHRVLEVVTGNDKALFYPQVKRLKFLYLVWRPICYSDGDIISYNSLGAANHFLHEQEMTELSDIVIKKRSHPFNLVHHKLSEK